MNHRIRKIASVICCTGTVIMGVSHAKSSDYPSSTITWVVPYLPGTGPDSNARIIANAMSKVLGQTVVVENRGGAAGNIGASVVKRARPDGYTWLYSSTALADNTQIYAKPGFDVMRDFKHVGSMSQSDSVIIVRPDSPYDQFQTLISKLKDAKEPLTYASGGVGTPSHLGAELVLAKTHTKALQIPYKGASESLNAVIGRQVDFALVLASVAIPQVKAGKIRPLAILTKERNPQLPQVPTVAELGIPDVDNTSIGGISVPMGTPDSTISVIKHALDVALDNEEVQSQLETTGVTISRLNGKEYTERLKNQTAWTDNMMKMTGLKPQ